MTGRRAPVGKWPLRSPDPNPCNFFLWRATKKKIYFRYLEIRNEWEDAIYGGFRSVRREQVQAATASVLLKATLCLEAEGGHFEYLF